MSRILGGFISGAADSTIKRRQVLGLHRVLQFAQLLDAQGLHAEGWENRYLKIKCDMGFEPPNALVGAVWVFAAFILQVRWGSDVT